MIYKLSEFFNKKIIISDYARDFSANVNEVKKYLSKLDEIGLIKASVNDDEIIIFDGVFRVISLATQFDNVKLEINSFLTKKYIKELKKLNIKTNLKDKEIFVMQISKNEYKNSLSFHLNNDEYMKLIDELKLKDYDEIINYYKEKYKNNYKNKLTLLFLGVIKAIYKIDYKLGDKIEQKEIISQVIHKNYRKKLNYKLENHLKKPLEKTPYTLARFCVDVEYLDIINNVLKKDLNTTLNEIYLNKNFSSKIAAEIAAQNEIIKNLSSDFKELIQKAKNHWYLDGRINFLLKMCEQNIDNFKEYFRIFCIIFGNKPCFNKHEADSKKMGGIINIKDENNSYEMLFRRALLVKGNYLRKKGKNYYFIKFGSMPYQKENNFFYVFNNHFKLLKQLFDDLKGLDEDEIVKKLKDLIADFNINDFRYELIKNPKHLRNLKLQISKNNKIKIFINEKKYYFL